MRGLACMPRHTFTEVLAIRRMYKVTRKKKKYMERIKADEEVENWGGWGETEHWLL